MDAGVFPQAGGAVGVVGAEIISAFAHQQENEYLRGMSEESIDKKNVRLFRWVAAIALLIVAGGIVAAIRMDNDILAGISCLVMGIALLILGRKEDDAKLHIGTGIGIGVGVFFLWMCIKYLIIA